MIGLMYVQELGAVKFVNGRCKMVRASLFLKVFFSILIFIDNYGSSFFKKKK